jgi:precorrin-2 dehydrogenase/sirohydrochlorin ferrochelatase
MATDPGLGSFIVPATIQQGPLTIAISTSGLSPAVARQIRESLEAQFGPEWTMFLDLLGLLRAAIQAKGLDTVENQRLFKELTKLPLLECVRKERKDQALEVIHGITHPWLSLEELSQIWTQAWKTSFSSSPPSATAVEQSDI